MTIRGRLNGVDLVLFVMRFPHRKNVTTSAAIAMRDCSVITAVGATNGGRAPIYWVERRVSGWSRRQPTDLVLVECQYQRREWNEHGSCCV